MTISAQELKFDLCDVHRTLEFTEHWPGYAFAGHIYFPPRSCAYPSCQKEAYYTVIGVPIPDAVGDLKQEKICRGIVEIFAEAKELLDGGPALDRLTYYLRTRIVPSKHREFLAKKLILQFAAMVLQKLKIDPECSLSDKDKHRVLSELGLFPEDLQE